MAGVATRRIGHLPHVFSALAVTDFVGITLRQLRYWEHLGLVRPSIRTSGGVSGTERKYSRDDVLAVKTVATLKSRAVAPGIIKRHRYHAPEQCLLAECPSLAFDRVLAELRASETWVRSGG